ncbi:hypothetical protein K2173_011978 [Erythroxylum novogranatense]|uniref:Methyltransferase type 11 domain-containing protein n=1 Tax=Erythroxylum novogranatense TaxID=1862640 RepID=A0AAV8TEG5_9ROSI|nr:hypothetical protein K2173_011978 [Erythroxylum novogranatense]
MLAELAPHHSLAWDVATGNGQAAIEVSKHYDQVIATDVSDKQLKHAKQDPKVQYLRTPLSMSDEDILNLFGGENYVDLVTVATSVHWFDLEKFSSIVKRVLRKPGGVIAVWTYGIIQASPEFDPLMFKRTVPFRNPEVEFAFQCYKTLPFQFQEVGLARERQPKELEMSKDMTFEGFPGLMRSGSGVHKAKEKGV